MTDSLEHISPSEAKEMYLKEKAVESSESTVQAHDYRLRHFVHWWDEEDLTNLNELSGRDLHRYRLWRREDGDLNNVTMVTQLSTLRVFLRWCERIDAVETDLHESIALPKLSKNEDRRAAMLNAESANNLLEYLRTFEFATRTHAFIELLWHSGMRIGAAHSLDLDDYDSENQRIEICHRPEDGTRLKNQGEGERYNVLRDEVCDVLDAYIKFNRHDVTDDYGRNPLFTSARGRPNKSTLRDSVYKITRPCIYTNECLHGPDLDSCEALDRNKASTLSIARESSRNTTWINHIPPIARCPR